MKDSDEMQETRNKTRGDVAVGDGDATSAAAAARNSIKSQDTDADFVRIRSVIERLRENRAEFQSNRYLERDVVTKVHGSLLLQDLVEKILTENGYNRIDVINAKGAILPTKKWLPVSLDAVTNNPKATVSDVIKGIEDSMILRIVLQNSNAICEQKLKDLLLQSLITAASDNFFQDSKCPLDKVTLERLRSGGALENCTETVINNFREWINSQDVASLFWPADIRHSNTAGTVPECEVENGVVSRPKGPVSSSNIMTPSSVPYQSPVFDPASELNQLENWFQETPDPSLTELNSYLGELNQRRYRQTTTALMLNDLVNWFQNARVRLGFGKRLSSGFLGKCLPSIYSKTFSINGERKRRRRNSNNEADAESKEFAVPHLPNKNAVYVIQPLQPDTSDSESVDMIQQTQDVDTTSRSSCSTSSQDVVLSVPVVRAPDKTSVRSDENHNDCPSPALNVSTEEATDLSLGKRQNLRWSKSITNWKSEADLHPSLRGSFKKMEKDAREYEVLSGSPSPPKEMAETMLPNAFLFPHYPLARIPHVPLHHNAIAMSHLFHAGSPFYNTPQPIFAPPHPYDIDDHSSPGSNSGENERRKRSRVFIDPNTEIPRLEQWFGDETHPSALQIEHYTNELNNAEYRQRFPKLEPKNVQLWFKNHRAKMKRMQNDDGVEKCSSFRTAISL